uniref:Uncharacterized protein n=1 Tax=Tanacetum cinerariifolium TaxID=118510 RepID=A0A6L2KDP4_TANCI|nr:hypothetical protein [Tanacetum cinerariifolium]
MGKGLLSPNGRRVGKVEVGFDNFRGGGEEIGNCGDNGGRVSSIFGRGEGSLAICSMESNDSLGGRGLVVVGEECLDGWVGAGGGEVKGGGVDLGVTKSLLGETPRESGSVDGGPFDCRWVVREDYKEGISDVGLRSNKDRHLFLRTKPALKSQWNRKLL